mgnify:CR=1 FL=1
MLQVPRQQYILVPDEMKRRGLVENRDIDAIVFSDDETKIIRIELKLLGIGNPEIGDEALARGVDLFLTDRLTEMMIKEAKKRSAKTLAICNVLGSTLARKSDQVIFTRAGPEIGVASTKAFLTQLAILYLFALYFLQSS